MGLAIRRYRELGEPAVAFASQGPTFEGPVPHVAAQHVPHEDPFPDPFFGNTLTDSGDSSAYVRALDPGKCHGFTRPGRVRSGDRRKPVRAAGIGIQATALEYQPIRVLMSVLLIAAAATSMRTSPAPGGVREHLSGNRAYRDHRGP